MGLPKQNAYLSIYLILLHFKSDMKWNIYALKDTTLSCVINWSDICTELQAAVPTLFKLLSGFLPKADQRFLALVICMLLKKRCKFMFLVQTVMSTLLYGQSAKKQIYNYLQPFMLYMSASMLQSIIDGVVKNYNADVFLWADNLKEHFELRFDIGLMPTLPLENDDDDDVAGEDNHEDDDYSDVESCYSDTSLDSPNWEPMETDESDVITSEVSTSEPLINSELSVAPEASGTNVIVQGLVRADTTTATVTADANRTISTTQKVKSQQH
ncbi:uncharacterized protein [Dysidea avara]|uniref:uncharacterized protein isoform X2 n=1 Tax=Dysidea avara TaxID=196820 RepID=UPI00331C78E9